MIDSKTMQASDDGVSPVIGVILMVAITVILAAVIGTFVLDLAGNTEQTPKAGFNFDETPNVSDSGNDGDGETNYDVKITVVNITSGERFFAEYPEYTAQNDTDSDSSGSDEWVASGSTLTSSDMTAAGDTVTAPALDVDDDITIIGAIEGNETVVQTYTVKGN